MRAILTATALVAGCAANEAPTVGEQQQAESSAYHAMFAGMGATASYRTETHGVTIQLGESIPSNAPADAFVFYVIGDADPTSLVCNGYCYYARWTWDYGYGAIPTSDVEITPAAAHLHTSTSVPGFTTQQCTYDQRTGENTCTAGTSGTVDVSWLRDGYTSDFSAGTARSSTPGWAVQTDGTYWSSSAQAHGDLAGRPVDVAYGTIDDTRQNYVGKLFTLQP